MPPLKEIVVLDDHKMFSIGLAQVLQSQLPTTHISICNTYEQLEEYTLHHQPDAAILDIELRGIRYNGLDACRLLHRLYPRCIRILCSMHPPGLYAAEAQRHQAHAYIDKIEEPHVLHQYLLTCSEQHPGQQFSVLGDYDSSNTRTNPFKLQKRFDKLTQREREIFDLLGQQMSLADIARFLNISYDTAKTHRTHLIQKLEVNSKEALYALALRS